MKLLNFTIIKLTICFIIGIVIGYLINVTLIVSLYITITLLLLLSIIFFINRNKFKKNIWFGLLTFITFISIGVLTVNTHNQQNFSNHYSYQISPHQKATNTILFRVRETLKPTIYHNKYIIDILNVNDNVSNGKALLNIEKDSLFTDLKVDNIYVTKASLNDIKPPLNPNQFNYKNYLAKQYIYHQLTLKHKSLFMISSKPYTLFGFANNFRDYINLKLKAYNFSPDVLAIINALFLGQRQHISEAIYTDYVNAGAIHILAVSGLHVGIILLIFSFLLKPLERLKKGYLIKTILLLFLLWSFALIAGLSASVTRAVTMFSIVTIAMNLKRPTNIYNTLAISMLLILLFKPLFIFDVGFQLSYLAVFAIVSIDPIIYSLWKPKYKLIDLYWHTLTVTIAAQLGIIPLSLFYFNQFPGLSFISNLVIIPLLGIILGFGILIFLLAIVNLLPHFIANSFEIIIKTMNDFINWVSKQEIFLIKDIAFNALYLIVSYFLIISLIQLLIKKNYNTLKLVLVAIVSFQTTVIFTNYTFQKNQFIIFHKNSNSLIGSVYKNRINIAHDLDSLTESKNKIVKNFMVKNHINKRVTDCIKSVYILNNKIVLVVDSLGVYNIKSIKPDYVYLRQSPKINLNRLIDSIQPKQIIADGSNYKSYTEHWEAVCKKRKLPFHQTSKNGAFIINY